MQLLKVKGINIYAYHGCLPEEAVIGGDYMVNVTLKGDFTRAAVNDNLADASDYVQVYQIVKREMNIRANLIENVAKRIAEHLKAAFPAVEHFSIEVIKKNPPIGGEVDEVSITVETQNFASQ
jgi:dihydroneopterin aldolase